MKTEMNKQKKILQREEVLQFLTEDQKALIAFLEDSMEDGQDLDMMLYPPCMRESEAIYSLKNIA